MCVPQGEEGEEAGNPKSPTTAALLTVRLQLQLLLLLPLLHTCAAHLGRVHGASSPVVLL